ncbi:CMRF35-like molecule 1 isoform X1 [Podarcis lilfordi]|uniref:CMRF35-like molecule 1 isoform X1 n=1 Tax=Podarcis lilfordi TaxID=74358 RepID=A0AA35JVC2_9SAUR|nr:CMRF35-like molecule 1 isoform X1 [Podarcis lilfordi]
MSLWRNWMLLTWVLLPGCMSDLTGPKALSGFLGRSLSVRCRYDAGFRKYVKYWCKGSSWSSCEIVVRTTGSEEERTASRLFIKDNHSRLEFTVRLENLTQEDAGIYWCGIERAGSDYGFPVNITVLPETWRLTGPVEVHGYEGKSLSLRCHYQQTFDNNTKSWCKMKEGVFFSSCESLISSDGKVNMGRVSLRENKKGHYFQVTMDSLNLDDSGVYHCVIERLLRNIRHRVNVTVIPASSSDSEETTTISWQSEPDLFLITTTQEQTTKQSSPDSSVDSEETTAISWQSEPDLFLITTTQEQMTKQSSPDSSVDSEETTAISWQSEPDLFLITTKQERTNKQSGFSPIPTEYLIYGLFALKTLIFLGLVIAIIWMHRRYNQKRPSAATRQENAAQ